MKPFLRLMLLVLLLGISLSLLAQEATPEATPELTPEATAELTPELTPEATPESTPVPESTEEADACPAIVQEALTITQEDCQDVRNNQACYGHLELNAEPQSGVTDFIFGQPGDRVDIVKVRSLSLGQMDEVSGVWGVALIQAQLKNDESQSQAASEPASPFQAATFLLFGDTAIENDVPMLPVTITGTVRMRSLPRRGSEIGILTSGMQTVASGRLEDDSWLVLTHPEEGTVGWVSAEFVLVEGDVEALNVVEPGEAEALAQQPQAPMQAFVFQSGRSDSPCDAAPNSGMLVQTPEGVASVTITIDEVVIQLNATAFIQAEPDGTMSVNVIDGAARVEANGESRTVVAGTKVDVPLDENLVPEDGPGEIEPFDPEELNSLPTNLLPNPVDVPEPLQIVPGVPLPGVWRFDWGVDELVCPSGDTITFDSTGILSDLSPAADGSTLNWQGSSYAQVSQGVYTTSFLDNVGNLYQQTMNVTAPDFISGEAVIDFAAVTCTLTAPFSLVLSVPGS